MNKEITKLNKAVDIFSKQMKEKLSQKKRQGFSGWDKKSYRDTIRRYLQEHVTQQLLGNGGQEIDIANFAMMLYFMNNEDGRLKLNKTNK